MNFERDDVKALLQKLVDGTAALSQRNYLLVALDCYTEEETEEMLEELDYSFSMEDPGQEGIRSSPEELEQGMQELRRRIALQTPKDTPNS